MGFIDLINVPSTALSFRVLGRSISNRKIGMETLVDIDFTVLENCDNTVTEPGCRIQFSWGTPQSYKVERDVANDVGLVRWELQIAQEVVQRDII
ncbi:MAG: hypothetical protein IGR92_07635 [Leptolyngbyaceae cyanobacterium T60_A2020_046]|nr:hypothetical protein [Leptolyngbyaceae cyanobacterium T60_A2020_046]